MAEWRLESRIAGPAIIACALVAVLAAGFAPATASSAPAPSVYVLVMDELPASLLMDRNGSLYRKRFPELARIAAGATTYPNNTSVADTTHGAVPAILTGEIPRGESPDFDSSRSLFALLRRTHQLNVLEPITTVCRRPYCSSRKPGESRRVGRMKVAVSPPGSSDWDIATNRYVRQLAWMINRAGSTSRPELWFAHAILPHAAWRFLPNGDQYYAPPDLKYPGIAVGGRWVGHEGLIRLGHQRAMLQMQFTDRLIGVLRRRLEKAGRWNSSMVVLTADHGTSFTAGTSRRSLQRGNLSEIIGTPLIVKYPRQKRGRAVVDKSATRAIDILPTIARETGTGRGRSFDGVLLSRAPRSRPVVARDGRDGGRVRKWGFSVFQRDRRRALRRQHARFPHVSPYSSTLLRKSAGRARSSRLAGSYTLDRPRSLKGIRPGSGWNPGVFLTGYLRGPNGTLMAVVNGRPRAVSRSWGNGRFAIMIDGLRRGDNRVALYLKRKSAWRLLRRR